MRLGYSIWKVNTVDLMDTVDFTELRAWHARDSRGETFVPLLNNLKVLSCFELTVVLGEQLKDFKLFPLQAMSWFLT